MIDIDLDCFTLDDGEAGTIRLYSDWFIQRIGKSLNMAADNGRLLVSTIALSPENCGGWPPAEHFLHQLSVGFGTDLNFIEGQ